MDWESEMERYKQEMCAGDQEAESNEENKLKEAENISVENDCRRNLRASDRKEKETLRPRKKERD